ncbi:MAG: Lrp/AsnC family transcriptional regulator [Enterococcaceae bacterium]|jgi:DNA-binding Lrp family transcriptional regulator|nr:Lrp/AsnC family transcriptional regulator [Enterococcaceae bacterium]MCI1919799.1 Lrp/AsnC family transcriptional regulator [Enterococcaceae bacterium]
MDQEKTTQLLRILEEDARRTPAEIAIMLSLEEEAVKKEIRSLEEQGIISGFRTLVNWDQVRDDWVEAMVELRVTPQGGEGYQKLADEIKGFSQVESLYLMSGGYDFLVMLQGRSLKDISMFISSNLASIPEVQSTTTHFVLSKYKSGGIDLDQGLQKDRRMRVTP